MPGNVLTTGSQVTCLHQGKATLSPGQTRVLAGGAPVVTTADLNTVAGCALSSATPPSPCATIDFSLAASSRVFVSNSPVVLEQPGPGTGLCVSANQARQGSPVISSVQTRVTGS
jgi:hypothetical protein